MKTNQTHSFDKGILFLIWAIALVLLVYPVSAYLIGHFVASTVRLVMSVAGLVLLGSGIALVRWEYKR